MNQNIPNQSQGTCVPKTGRVEYSGYNEAVVKIGGENLTGERREQGNRQEEKKKMTLSIFQIAINNCAIMVITQLYNYII